MTENLLTGISKIKSNNDPLFIFSDRDRDDRRDDRRDHDRDDRREKKHKKKSKKKKHRGVSTCFIVLLKNVHCIKILSILNYAYG